MSRCAAVILARYDSTRLPGKVLKPLAGKPLLSWSIEQLLSDPAFIPVVATTNRDCDTPICDLAEKLGATLFLGSLKDVAGRTLGAAREVNAEIFARVNGDSPFVRLDLLKQALYQIRNTQCEFCTNLIPRAFPYGISVEMFRTDYFEICYQSFETDYQREHVTAYFYSEGVQHLSATIAYPHGNDHDVRLVVDTSEDHAAMEKLMLQLDKKTDSDIQKIVGTYRHLRNKS